MKTVRNVLLILLCLVIVVGVWFGRYFGLFVLDKSVVMQGNGMQWNGHTYSLCSVTAYHEGDTLAKVKKQQIYVREVEEDPSHTFVVVRMGLSNDCYVDDNYTIPTEGTITTVSWDKEYISDPVFTQAIAAILAEKEPSFVHKTDSIYSLTDTQRMKPLYVAYEQCPVTTEPKGYLGKIDGRFVITVLDIVGTVDLLEMYVVPQAYTDILEDYFPE